jgi:hypothetical protein
MKASEVIAMLQELPQDLEVVVAADDEGNSFRKVPEGWVSIERFDSNLDIIASEDYDEFDEDELESYICIG